MATKILLADKLADGAFEGLDGVEVISRPELDASTLPDAIAGVKVLVVRSTKVTAATFEKADALGLVVRAGSGYNNIDVAAASARGVWVANCPGRNAVAVAELAMGLMISLDRRIPDNVADLRAGKWNKKEYSKAAGLKGKTLGLVGFGNIGLEVSRRAQAFGMDVISFAISLTSEQAKAERIVEAKTLAEVLTAADVVSLHVPATPETTNMISTEQLAQMKDGAILINTSRHEVVDAAALEAVVASGRIRYGADVFAGEPEAKEGRFEDPLVKHPNVYGTHHIGASTQQAQDAVAELAIEIVTTYLASGEVPHAVNADTRVA